MNHRQEENSCRALPGLEKQPNFLSRSINNSIGMHSQQARLEWGCSLRRTPPNRRLFTRRRTFSSANHFPWTNHDGIVDFYILHSYSHFHDEHALSVCQFEKTRSTHFCYSSGNNAIREIVSKSGPFGAALRSGAKIQHGDRFRTGRARLGGVRSFQTGNRTMWYGPWANGGKGIKNRYLGLKFRINGQFHFGWARLTFTTTKISFTATLTGYAYETIPGKAIIAGSTKDSDNTRIEVPNASLTASPSEPPTLGMLARGAPTLAIWRRENIVEARSKPN
jgi:hypothetical protein